MPSSGTAIPKNTMKNCGWARKLPRQLINATAAVQETTITRAASGLGRIRPGQLPSGNRTTAQT